MAKLLMLGAALFGVQAAPAAPDVLAPSGKWVVEPEDTMCLLSRRFGTGAAQVTLALRSTPGERGAKLYLIRAADKGGKGRDGNAEVTLEPGRHVVRPFTETTTPDGVQLVASLPIMREEIDALGAARTITIKLGQDATVWMRPDNIAGALRAHAGCEDALVKSWGLDPATLRTLRKHAEPTSSPEGWIRDADYPEEALGRRLTGEVAVLLTIDAGGNAQHCTVTRSSGFEILDSRACLLLGRKGHFRPALDKDGRPTPSLWATSVTWHLPPGV